MGRNFIMAGALYVGISMSAWASNAVISADYEREMRDDVTSMESIVEPVYNRTVSTYIRWYAEGPKGYMSELLERSDLYFPYIESKLHEAGLPEELKYLVVIESALKPDIRSRVGASGLWQLMTPTARYFGLRVDRSVDERLDPYRSTEAAIIYLKDLYDQFGDWSLAMAAYNAGPGRVRNAIRLSGSEDFWKLQYHLPPETQKYIPKFIAAQYFFTKMDLSHLDPQPVPHDLIFTTELALTRSVNLKEAAQALNLNFEVLQTLNTSWKRYTIGSEQGNYSVRIPSRLVQDWLNWEYRYRNAKYIDQLEEAEELLYSKSPKYLNFTYRVQKGESLQLIAQNFGIKEYLIRYWNDLSVDEIVREGAELKMVLPTEHECAYVAEILSRVEESPILEVQPLQKIRSKQDSNLPKNIEAVPIVTRIRDHQSQRPVILPRGMSASQYSFYAQDK